MRTVIMKLFAALAAIAATASAIAASEPKQAILDGGAELERFLIELGPGETRWITEDEKWELRRVCSRGKPYRWES